MFMISNWNKEDMYSIIFLFDVKLGEYACVGGKDS